MRLPTQTMPTVSQSAKPLEQFVAIARRTFRERLRSRAVLGTIAIAAAQTGVMWDELSRVGSAPASLAAAVMFAAVLSGSGLIGDESASGAIHLDLLAGTSPTLLVLGGVLGCLVAIVPAALLPGSMAVPVAARAVGGLTTALLVFGAAAAAIGVLGFAALVGTFVPGKGNAAALFGVFLFSAAASTIRKLSEFAPWIDGVLKALSNMLPSPFAYGSWSHAVLNDQRWPLAESLGVFVAPLVWLVLAAVALEWRARRGIAEAA